MTLNKWTVALAALGVVSFASAVNAEEKASAVMTALSSTTISGYVDTSAQWNFGTGNANLPAYRFGGPSKADGFNLNVVQVRIESPLDQADWAAGYRVDLWAGPDANTLNTPSINADGTADFAIRQAYVALRMPLGNGLDWKIGVFDSIIGYESVEGPSNPNFTRSYGSTIEPTSHTGALVSYKFNDLISASGGVANTYGPIINERAHNPYNDRAESYKTYMASLALTAPESMGFLAGSTLYGGFISGFDSAADFAYGENVVSYYAGATIATPVTGLRVGGAFDMVDVRHTDGETWSVAGYASFQATEKLSFHARGEYLKDRGDQSMFVAYDEDNLTVGRYMPEETLAITGTIQYDLWKNVLSRLEVRWDHSLDGSEPFGSEDGTGGLKNAWMLAANIVYRF
jgi:hypothetical protein